MNDQSTSIWTRAALATMASTLLAGATLIWLQPERVWAWLSAMLFLPVAWALLRSFAAKTSRHLSIHKAMTGAGLIFSVSMLALIAQDLAVFDAAPGELADRAWGLIMGSMLAVYANVIPKQAAAPGRARVLRFCGWALVLGGLGYALIWLLAPIAVAKVLAMMALGAAVLAVLLRVLVARHRHDGEPTESC